MVEQQVLRVGAAGGGCLVGLLGEAGVGPLGLRCGGGAAGAATWPPPLAVAAARLVVASLSWARISGLGALGMVRSFVRCGSVS